MFLDTTNGKIDIAIVSEPKSYSIDDVIRKPKLRKCSKFGCNENPIKLWVEGLFYKQGLLVGQYPLWFIVIPFIITVTLSCGIFKYTLTTDINGMLTPSNAYSNYEIKTLLNFFQDEGGLFIFYLGFQAKDGSSVLREEYRKSVLASYNYFNYNYTFAYEGKSYSFADLQVGHTEENLVATIILKNYNTSNTSNDLIKFTYPVSFINKQPYYVGESFRKVELNSKTKLVEDLNIVWFHFYSSKVNKSHEILLNKWAESFIGQPRLNLPKLEYYFFNEQLVALELMRNGWTVAPYVVLAFTVTTMFALFVSSTKNPVTSKPFAALASVVAVILACGSGFGIVYYAGYPFAATTVVAPILVLALGMDVTYITLRNWRSTDPNSTPHERLAKTLQESGPSIVITVLTNVLSTAIGCYTNILLLYIFCLTLCLSLIILFLLQMTFVAAFLAYAGRRESTKKHGWIICLTVNSDIKVVEKSNPEIVTNHNVYHDWWYTFSAYISKILCTIHCRFAVCLITIIYWSTSIYCCYQMKLGLTVDKLFPLDSPLLQFIKLDNDVNESGSMLLYVVVSNPPNFSEKNDRFAFESLVKDFESSPYCIGSNASSIWVAPYESFMSYFEDNNQSNYYNYLDDFLKSSTGSKWNYYIKTEKVNGTGNPVKRFIFTVVYVKTYDWDIRNSYTYMARDIAQRYQRFDITTWYDDNQNYVTDQLASIPSNTLQDIIVTTICMAVVCIMFIPNLFNTLCTITTVCSINVGTFGYLLAWDVALDPVSMGCLLIAIGYSVDFTAHISYHYYASRGTTQEEKLKEALSSIGLPMLETGFSTLICVACLCFVPCYFELVFFKTIFLVIICGLAHGFIILPTFLAWIPLNCLETLFLKKAKICDRTMTTVVDNGKIDNNELQKVT